MAKSFLPEPPATTLIAKASNFRPATVEQASALFEIMMRDLMLPLESIMAGWAERLPLYKEEGPELRGREQHAKTRLMGLLRTYTERYGAIPVPLMLLGSDASTVHAALHPILEKLAEGIAAGKTGSIQDCTQSAGIL